MTNVGITGHQKLADPTAWAWIESAINNELDRREPPLTAVSSLAAGADQLFASTVLNRGGQIHAVIPFAEYERTFSPQDLQTYRRLLSKALAVEVLKTRGTDEDAYLAAGKRVVESADLMIAVWDGLPAKGKGGTADIVAYAIEKHIRLVHINPLDRTVTPVAPRSSPS